MIYIGNIEILTAKSAIYLGNVGFNDVLGCVENVIEFWVRHGQDITTSGAGVTVTAWAKLQIVRAFAIFRLGLISLYPPVSPVRVRRGNL